MRTSFYRLRHRWRRLWESLTVVTIRGLTRSQRIALEDMLATWQAAGGRGSSRWTSYYADGDGNFRPRIRVNGRRPQTTSLLPREQFWTGGAPWAGEYRVDNDWIAWRLPDGQQ